MKLNARSPQSVRSGSSGTRRPGIRRTVAAGVAACAGAALSCGGIVASGAAPISEFYTPPAQFATAPGSVIKTEPMPVFVAPPGFGPWPANAQKIMYTSQTQDGDPVAVSGTYLDATSPWQGTGPRPTVVIAPGTSGQGDQCAPSEAFATGLYAQITPPSVSANQEAVSAMVWHAMGARVLVTDYIGLGTPGVHTYVNRVEEAHAVLDAARAANALSGTGPQTPLAFWGYSQGGGSTAAAAVPYPQARQLANDWCGKGATVTFRSNGLPPILPGMALPNHFGPEIIDGFSPTGVIPYLMDRLNDKPISGCTIA